MTTFPEHARGVQIEPEHRLACDPARVFLEEHYIQGTPDDYLETAKAYGDFREWCSENGYRHRSARTFADDVRRVFGVVKQKARRNGAPKWIFPGLRPLSWHDEHGEMI